MALPTRQKKVELRPITTAFFCVRTVMTQMAALNNRKGTFSKIRFRHVRSREWEASDARRSSGQ
jgi:hypothetical protein